MLTTEDALASCEGYARAAFAASGDRRTRDVALYLAHVGAGVPMRALARARGRQPSTVMRAIRRIEALRDDPLLERALTTLEEEAFSLSRSIVKKDTTMQTDSARPSRRGPRLPGSAPRSNGSPSRIPFFSLRTVRKRRASSRRRTGSGSPSRSCRSRPRRGFLRKTGSSASRAPTFPPAMR
ncbi:MAG: hypothetical protein ACE37J_05615 [Pikeienuella sp.]|uniref:hypothetical protein n=1 Tax=Pikeienuella sp. TaxID=2831957 RepID=UPI00391C9984